MAMKVRNTGGAGREPIAAGTYPAVIYSVLNMGTAEGKFGMRTQLNIGYTIPSIRKEIDGKDLPATISQFYNATMNPKGNFYGVVKGALGRDPSEQEIEEFSVENLIGTNIMISVVHKKKADGTVRDSVAAVLGKVAGMPDLPVEVPTVLFDFEVDGAGNVVFPENFPEGFKKIVYETEEYAEAVTAKMGAPASAPAELPKVADAKEEQIPGLETEAVETAEVADETGAAAGIDLAAIEASLPPGLDEEAKAKIIASMTALHG